MRPIVLGMAGALLGLSFVAGWLLTPALRAPDATAAAAAPQAAHQGEVIGANLRRLSALTLATPPPPPVIAADSGPPPPDIAVLFRRDLTAVVRAPLGPVVWVVDPAGRLNRRVLRVGDTYRDGWRIAAIDNSAVTLRRRGESRRVGIMEVAPDILLPPDHPRPPIPVSPPMGVGDDPAAAPAPAVRRQLRRPMNDG